MGAPDWGGTVGPAYGPKSAAGIAAMVAWSWTEGCGAAGGEASLRSEGPGGGWEC
ncbi:hypothetical protein ACGFZR_24385 [Streptomyces sp. NPDC048241]|uniref:hypothetical protein n=1 Tax=Streptomyces sp. NPDC048241 TaxID=3365521 RepID=UPI003719B443